MLVFCDFWYARPMKDFYQATSPRLLTDITHSVLRSKRFASFLVGIWFGCLLTIVVGVPASFRAIRSVIENPIPQAALLLEKLGPEASNQLLRYQVSEANRLLFEYWGWIQVTLGVMLFGYLLFGSKCGKVALFLAFGMLILSILLNWMMIPKMVALGRSLHFNANLNQAGGPEVSFRNLHLMFTLFEGTVVLFGVLLLGRLFRGGHGRGF